MIGYPREDDESSISGGQKEKNDTNPKTEKYQSTIFVNATLYLVKKK